jgi:hypothetical protein
LFPDQGRENRFFVETPRKIFAHLLYLNLRPTPEQLTYWMCHAEEIDKRVAGTEMAAMIDRHAAAQRSGVLGSLNMVADAFKLLPNEGETQRTWSTVAWAREPLPFVVSPHERIGNSAPSSKTRNTQNKNHCCGGVVCVVGEAGLVGLEVPGIVPVPGVVGVPPYPELCPETDPNPGLAVEAPPNKLAFA